MVWPHQQQSILRGTQEARGDSLSLRKRPRVNLFSLFLPSLGYKNEPNLLGSQVPGALGVVWGPKGKIRAQEGVGSAAA